MLEFRILGPLEVVDNGSTIALSGQKQRALLALLLLRANEVVPAERLIEELWGETAPKTAATSLQNFVSQLRKALGPELLETRPPGYRLRVTPEQLDLARFEQLVRAAREQEAERRAGTLAEALSLWRGSPLVDFAYEAFAQNEIRRLEELRLAAVEDRFDAELELGRDAELVGELEALVREHPLRERLRGQLMLALYRAGRQGDALQQFHNARRALVDELGIEPSPELQRLHAAILRQETRLELGGPARPEGEHLLAVAKAILAGRLVPLIGHDVSELAGHLAGRFDYPDSAAELPRISQYIAVMRGSGPLYDELHDLLGGGGSGPTPVHRFFASLAPILRAVGAPHQLLVTTSYDLALEEAFLEAGEEFDVVWYVASGRNRGKFCHLSPDGAVTLIELPNTYARELSLERRTVILKLHGRFDPSPAREWESFVVTEDDYIDYLAQNELANAVPVSLAATLRRSHFLFLTYAMRDWNLRVILNRLWRDDALSYRSWAVQPQPLPLERAFWQRREVEVVDADLDDYLTALGNQLAALAPMEETA